jgi:uncharacterized caspase-like protein
LHFAHDADVALVYYRGHAMQRYGFNSVDAVFHDEADLRWTRDDILADLVKPRIPNPGA